MADKSFADYVKDLMGVLPTVNGNPMLSVTSMTDENARYREDPFYISRDIQERNRLAAEEAAKQAAQSESGVFGAMPEGGGGDTTDTTGPSFFSVQPGETPAGRDSRVSSWATANPIQAQVLSLVQQGLGKTPYGMLQSQLSPDYVRDVSLGNIMNRAQTAQINQNAASVARQAAIDAARGTALGTTGYGLYNQSTNSGDWGWVDNMSNDSFAGMVADMQAADAAGNAAAAAAMGIKGSDI